MISKQNRDGTTLLYFNNFRRCTIITIEMFFPKIIRYKVKVFLIHKLINLTNGQTSIYSVA